MAVNYGTASKCIIVIHISYFNIAISYTHSHACPFVYNYKFVSCMVHMIPNVFLIIDRCIYMISIVRTSVLLPITTGDPQRHVCMIHSFIPYGTVFALAASTLDVLFTASTTLGPASFQCHRHQQT